MWPWGHIAVAYLVYTVFLHVNKREPTGQDVMVLCIGSLLPDLIDKPLALWLHVLPEGRSLAHSVLFALPIVTIVLYYSRRIEQPHLSTAFLIGYGSHLLSDGWHGLLTVRFGRLSYLLWPLLDAPNYSNDTFGAHFDDIFASLLNLNLSLFIRDPLGPLTGQAVLSLTALLLWISHGSPGFRIVWRIGRDSDVE